MTQRMSAGRLFITGTDTGVGKTHVTCLIARQMIARGERVAAYKPVCSGAFWPDREVSTESVSPKWDDLERLKQAIGGDWTDDQICPQRFLAPLAPPIAARLEKRTVDFQQLVSGADAFCDVETLLIEGAGGWLSPLTETQSVADLAAKMKAPILIVARTGLGTINHTLLTVQSIRAIGLVVAGIVLNEPVAVHNDDSIQTNADEIEARSGAPVLGTVFHDSSVELHRNGKPVTINWRKIGEYFRRTC